MLAFSNEFLARDTDFGTLAQRRYKKLALLCDPGYIPNEFLEVEIGELCYRDLVSCTRNDRSKKSYLITQHGEEYGITKQQGGRVG